MPPKRKAAPTSAVGTSKKTAAAAAAASSAAKKRTSKPTRSNHKRQPLSAAMDMYIHRPDDSDDSDDDGEDAASTSAKPLPTPFRVEDEYEPESDEASSVASDDAADEEARDGDVRVKTVSAANLAFLSGLEKNKALNVSHKDAKAKAKDLKRSDRKQFEEERRRIAAENKAKLTQPLSDSEYDSLDDDDDEMSGISDEEEVVAREKKNFQEYSDVSEGEEVGGASSSDEEPPAKRANKKRGEQDAEAAYLARLGKRKAREAYMVEEERKKSVNAKLPVRKLSDDESDVDQADSSDEDQDQDMRQDSEPEGLGSDYASSSSSEDEAANKKTSRAVHAPLPKTQDSDSEAEAAPTTPAVAHSSITHSSRFNLTAPYEILLTSHASRLPAAPPASSKNRKAVLAYKSAVSDAQKRTLLLARNQIASLSSTIIADPEVNLGMLRRLAVFAAPTIAAPPEKIAEIRAEQAEIGKARARPTKLDVPVAVRQLAVLSLLAVFVDILPGYRIRALTDKEQEEKVGQEVARRREYEAGLVAVYRDYLELCENEVKAAAAIASGGDDAAASKNNKKKNVAAGVGKLDRTAIKVFTTLAQRATHFNFRQNILGVVVARMSRRTWGSDEESCFEAIKAVVLADLTGEVSLEVVRLIHRMTKERRFKINSRVLDILLFLRLKDELGNKRASTTTSVDPEKEAEKARKEYEEKRAAMKAREKGKKGGGKGVKAKEVRKGLATHASKKQVKKQKELKAIEDEMKEASAEVDREERERNQTETLKLVFVLYFTVLKAPIGSVALGVLESTLGGLSRYAHRVNVDFFRDLLNVLKQHVQVNAALLEENKQEHDSDAEDSSDELDEANVLLDQTTLTRTIRHIIISLKTTFDLFLGQHETSILNLDLTDLLSHFYAALFYLPFVNETHLQLSSSTSTIVDLALDSLYAILIRSRTRFAPHILAGFAKRLAIISLHLPITATSGPRKVLGLIAHLLTKQSTSASADSQLALLDLEDRSRNGSYQSEGGNLNTSGVLQSGQSIAWELAQLKGMANHELAIEADRVWALRNHNQS